MGPTGLQEGEESVKSYTRRIPRNKTVELNENSNALDKFNHTFYRVAQELTPWGFIRGRAIRRELLLRGKAFTFRVYFRCNGASTLKFGVYVNIFSDRLAQWHRENYADTNHQLEAGNVLTLPLRALVDGGESERFDVTFEVERERVVRSIVDQVTEGLYPFLERFEEGLIGLVDQVAREGFAPQAGFVTNLNFLLCFGNAKKAQQGMENFLRAMPEYRALYEEYRREDPLNFMISKGEYGLMIKEILYNHIEIDFTQL